MYRSTHAIVGHKPNNIHIHTVQDHYTKHKVLGMFCFEYNTYKI